MEIERVHHESVGSTNDVARDLWRSGKRHPVLVSAAEQVRGRGRLERTWVGPVGGAWMSLLWPCDPPRGDAPDATPLLAGLVVAQCLELLAPASSPSIKWPNDVLADGRKIAGILCERELGRERGAIVVGMGVNVNNEPPEALQPGLAGASLREFAGCEIPVGAVVGAIAERLPRLLASGFTPRVRTEIERRLAWMGRAVSLNGEPAGTLEGLDEVGRIVLEADGQRRAVASGELSLRRLPAGA